MVNENNRKYSSEKERKKTEELHHRIRVACREKAIKENLIVAAIIAFFLYSFF